MSKAKRPHLRGQGSLVRSQFLGRRVNKEGQRLNRKGKVIPPPTGGFSGNSHRRRRRERIEKMYAEISEVTIQYMKDNKEEFGGLI